MRGVIHTPRATGPYNAPSVWDFLSYPRALFYLVSSLIITALMCLVILFVAVVIRNRRILDWFIVYLWSLPLLKPGGIAVEVRGPEKVPLTGKGLLLLFNHSSLLDIPVLYSYFPRSFRFGAKVELFNIPFFGWAMKACGVLRIDRNRRNKVMKIYEEAIGRIENGECFALAPEGTRQSDVQLGKFKRGPFEFAINAKCAVVPVVIAGCAPILPKKSPWINLGRWRRTILVDILPPVDGAAFTIEQSEEFALKVRAQMEKSFTQLNAELSGFSTQTTLVNST